MLQIQAHFAVFVLGQTGSSGTMMHAASGDVHYDGRQGELKWGSITI